MLYACDVALMENVVTRANRERNKSDSCEAPVMGKGFVIVKCTVGIGPGYNKIENTTQSEHFHVCDTQKRPMSEIGRPRACVVFPAPDGSLSCASQREAEQTGQN
jgi:hypothetical protein